MKKLILNQRKDKLHFIISLILSPQAINYPRSSQNNYYSKTKSRVFDQIILLRRYYFKLIMSLQSLTIIVSKLRHHLTFFNKKLWFMLSLQG